MRIAYLPLNIDGAGCYRCIFPAAYLSDRGHDAAMPGFVLMDGNDKVVRPLPGTGLSAVPPGDFQLVLLEDTVGEPEIVVVELGSKVWQAEWAKKLKNKGAKIILDLDDDLHRIPTYNPGQLGTKENNRLYTEQILEIADHVTVATQALADFYSKFNENVTVLRNRLHWPMWESVPPVYERKDWKSFRVGYMGNMAFHDADLKLIAKPLKQWLMKHKDAEFVAAGDPRMHKIVKTPKAQQVTTAKVWFRNMDLPYITSTFDVGLVPLVDNDFNRCKSWLKGIEYAACGIPSIASRLPEYEELEKFSPVMLCDDPKDFIAALDLLYEDRIALRECGERARLAASELTFANHIHKWEGVYENVLGYRSDSKPAGEIVIAGTM